MYADTKATVSSYQSAVLTLLTYSVTISGNSSTSNSCNEHDHLYNHSHPGYKIIILHVTSSDNLVAIYADSLRVEKAT